MSFIRTEVHYHNRKQKNAPDELFGEIAEAKHVEPAAQKLKREHRHKDAGGVSISARRVRSPEDGDEDGLEYVRRPVVRFRGVGSGGHDDPSDTGESAGKHIGENERPRRPDAGKSGSLRIRSHKVQIDSKDGFLLKKQEKQ